MWLRMYLELTEEKREELRRILVSGISLADIRRQLEDESARRKRDPLPSHTTKFAP